MTANTIEAISILIIVFVGLLVIWILLTSRWGAL